MRKTLGIMIAAAMLSTNSLQAKDDGGMQLSAGASSDITNKWSVGIEAEMRTQSSFSEIDRWALGIDGSYKPFKFLKFTAGYILQYKHYSKKTSYDDNGDMSSMRPAYYCIRHRFHINATGSMRVGNFNFSLRERWQITYRPEKMVKSYDYVNDEWGELRVASTCKHELRSRLQVEYTIPNCKITPYVNAEFFNTLRLEKTRLIGGADWKFAPSQSIGLFYRYQIVNRSVSSDKNVHIIGAKYKYKF